MIERLLNIDWSVVVSVSLVTSLIFLLFLAIIRPIIRVSKIILWSIGENEEKGYKIKVVNWTMANIYDVKIELFLATVYGDGDGTSSIKYTKIPFRNDQSEFIYLPSMVWKNGRKNAGYAHVFITLEDIEGIWTSSSQHLEFRMVAKHGLSGFNKVIIKRFTDKDVIKEGRFVYGISRKCKVS